MCRLYGKVACDVFYGTWVPLMHVVPTRGTIFNCENIMASSLKKNIAAAKHPELKQLPKFYMASYLLDVVFTRCQFENWSYKWETSETNLVHHHYKVFWDTLYKSMIDVISESFIAPLYVQLYDEEPTCMSKRAMETVVKVAHWFPIQEGTFIRVFGTHKVPHVLPRFVHGALKQLTSNISRAFVAY